MPWSARSLHFYKEHFAKQQCPDPEESRHASGFGIGDIASDEPESVRGKNQHSQQDHSVTPTVNICIAVGSFFVVHRDLHNLQANPGCSKDEIEIAERIEVAEVLPIPGQP